MMNSSMFAPIALEDWYSDDGNDFLLQKELDNYLQNYFPCYPLQPQRKLFHTFIQGLLSPLERKSIEPIALHFSGEKYVRPLQQFFTRSPFDEQPLLDTYRELLSRQIGAGAGMLSVDDTSFVKKGKHSVGVKWQYCGRLVTMVMGLWTMNCRFLRNGLVMSLRSCVRNVISRRDIHFPPKMRLPDACSTR
ncbi:transposase [Blautia hominis]|uniref:transposase n=1 Tax=Blautia hominis TaxID=2025493 RepID=UPI0036F2565A